MLQSAAGYVHRIGRTGRAYNTGASVSLVSSEENDMFEGIKSFIGESDNVNSNFIAPFPLLTKNAVEGLRYRAEVYDCYGLLGWRSCICGHVKCAFPDVTYLFPKELAQLTCEKDIWAHNLAEWNRAM
ncbi:DEAD-box ATP-dependent RNA helicase 16-like [Coffea arabica]|uniref:DEAD-box ATP-dependent RNA helicase 16-like n=1 Tax=Coffea arabica TaxID=13443 RepID=A0ABM4WB79_COFAR